MPTITIAQALDVVLCWEWIDGIRKALDERAFLQRYTPRRARSVWSQINRDHVARLTAAGRMTPHGQRQVDAAKADGRWDVAALVTDPVLDSLGVATWSVVHTLLRRKRQPQFDLLECHDRFDFSAFALF